MTTKAATQRVRFTDEFRQELAQPSPTGSGVLRLKKRLRRIALSFMRYWGRAIPGPEERTLALSGQELLDDEINLALAGLFERYKHRPVTATTEKVVQRVIDQVRAAYTREVARRNATGELSEEDRKVLGSDRLFQAGVDLAVEPLEFFYQEGVIDKAEYFLVLANMNQMSTVDAAALIDMEPSTARSCLREARARLEVAIHELEEGKPLTKRDTRGRNREVDEEKLDWAIRKILIPS